MPGQPTAATGAGQLKIKHEEHRHHLKAVLFREAATGDWVQLGEVRVSYPQVQATLALLEGTPHPEELGYFEEPEELGALGRRIKQVAKQIAKSKLLKSAVQLGKVASFVVPGAGTAMAGIKGAQAAKKLLAKKKRPPASIPPAAMMRDGVPLDGSPDDYARYEQVGEDDEVGAAAARKPAPKPAAKSAPKPAPKPAARPAPARAPAKPAARAPAPAARPAAPARAPSKPAAAKPAPKAPLRLVSKPAPKPAAKLASAPKPAARSAPKPAARPAPKPAAKPAAKLALVKKPAPASKSTALALVPKTAAAPKAKPAAKPKPAPKAKPAAKAKPAKKAAKSPDLRAAKADSSTSAASVLALPPRALASLPMATRSDADAAAADSSTSAASARPALAQDDGGEFDDGGDSDGLDVSPDDQDDGGGSDDAAPTAEPVDGLPADGSPDDEAPSSDEDESDDEEEATDDESDEPEEEDEGEDEEEEETAGEDAPVAADPVQIAKVAQLADQIRAHAPNLARAITELPLVAAHERDTIDTRALAAAQKLAALHPDDRAAVAARIEPRLTGYKVSAPDGRVTWVPQKSAES